MANLRDRHDSKSHREREAAVTTLPFSFSFFYCCHIRELESLHVQLLEGEAKERKKETFPSLEKVEARPLEGDCHHADLRIASGRACVRAEEKGERKRLHTYTAERERGREAALKAQA